MMKKISIIVFVFLSIYLSSQNPNNWDTAWVSSFGGPSIDIGKDIKETSDKGFIIAGTTSSFGDGNTSFYIIKTDSLGHHEWSRSIGSSNNDVAYSVDIASDGGYFFSGISNLNIQTGYDGYLIKTDNLGNVLWTKNYGGNDWDFIYNSCLMPDGGLILCGETYSGSNGGTDAYIIRTNSNGDTLWTKKIGTTGDDSFYSVEQKNNRIYVVGKTFNINTGKNDACVFKLDFNGTVLKQDFFGTAGENRIYNDLFMTATGDILLAGKRNTPSSDYFILRKTDTTNFSEINYITSTQNMYFTCVTEGNNNEVYTLAPSPGGAGGLSALYYRLNSAFVYLNSSNFGGIKDDEGYEIIRTSKGYAMIGWTKSYGNQNNSNDENVYLVVFNKKDLLSNYFLITTEFQDNLSPVSIKENNISLQKTTVYPNPVNTLATIKFEDNTLDGKTLNYKLFDAQGKLVNEETLLVSENHVMIDRKEIKNGVYTYRLSLNAIFICTGKISVE